MKRTVIALAVMALAAAGGGVATDAAGAVSGSVVGSPIADRHGADLGL
jgi:hypothetical protein